MPKSEKQRRFAFAMLKKKKAGKPASGFKGMSAGELDDYARSPLEKKGKKSKSKSKKWKKGGGGGFRTASQQAQSFAKDR